MTAGGGITFQVTCITQWHDARMDSCGDDVSTRRRWPRGFNARPLKIQYLSTSRRGRAVSLRASFSPLRIHFTLIDRRLSACQQFSSCQSSHAVLHLHRLVGHHFAGILEFKALRILRGKYTTLHFALSFPQTRKITWLINFSQRITLKNIACISSRK